MGAVVFDSTKMSLQIKFCERIVNGKETERLKLLTAGNSVCTPSDYLSISCDKLNSTTLEA